MVIDYNALACFPKWKVRWADLRAYQLDKNKGVLLLKNIDGKAIEVKGIEEKDFDAIETMIKKYLREERD